VSSQKALLKACAQLGALPRGDCFIAMLSHQWVNLWMSSASPLAFSNGVYSPCSKLSVTISQNTSFIPVRGTLSHLKIISDWVLGMGRIGGAQGILSLLWLPLYCLIDVTVHLPTTTEYSPRVSFDVNYGLWLILCQVFSSVENNIVFWWRMLLMGERLFINLIFIWA
jgi:hypothetical protein